MGKITAFIKQEKDSKNYWVYSPSLPGCYSQGRTKKEALAHFSKAARVHLAARREIERRLSERSGVQSFELEVKSRA